MSDGLVGARVDRGRGFTWMLGVAWARPRVATALPFSGAGAGVREQSPESLEQTRVPAAARAPPGRGRARQCGARQRAASPVNARHGTPRSRASGVGRGPMPTAGAAPGDRWESRCRADPPPPAGPSVPPASTPTPGWRVRPSCPGRSRDGRSTLAFCRSVAFEQPGAHGCSRTELAGLRSTRTVATRARAGAGAWRAPSPTSPPAPDDLGRWPRRVRRGAAPGPVLGAENVAPRAAGAGGDLRLATPSPGTRPSRPSGDRVGRRRPAERSRGAVAVPERGG